jgi:hypothetical protein
MPLIPLINQLEVTKRDIDMRATQPNDDIQERVRVINTINKCFNINNRLMGKSWGE